MEIRKFLCLGYFADRVFRLVCDTTHNSFQASLRRRTTATRYTSNMAAFTIVDSV